MTTHKLLGRIFLTGEIKTESGLRIGGSTATLSIGGVDLPVIRDPISDQPYIPGSSLKGKLRSLSEKFSAAPQNKSVGEPKIHIAGESQKRPRKRGDESDADFQKRLQAYKTYALGEYNQYWVNPVFGVPSDLAFDVPAPNRLIVRDVPMSDESSRQLLGLNTDLPYTEVKWEVVIDRVTSKANPRQIERVPRGVTFKPMEMVFNVYLKADVQLFSHLFTAMELLEGDYLGGHGSRGSGKISFQKLSVFLRCGPAYQKHEKPEYMDKSLSELIAQKTTLEQWLSDTLAP
jgi:CRISPR-associated protein Csm3